MQDSDANECSDNSEVEEESDAKRPKKRQKIMQDDGDAETENFAQFDATYPAPGDQQTQITTYRSPTPAATLPSFPLPAVPDAPPKSVLAIQGLDQALVDANVVDPANFLPIPSDGDDDAGTGLTEKTRRRLRDLGITELFAGWYSFLSF